jgi:hypothetical protein
MSSVGVALMEWWTRRVAHLFAVGDQIMAEDPFVARRRRETASWHPTGWFANEMQAGIQQDGQPCAVGWPFPLSNGENAA